MERAHSQLETPAAHQAARPNSALPSSDLARGSNSMLQLQRTAGNQAASRLLLSGSDTFEREADRVADHITQTSDSQVGDVTRIASGRQESPGIPPLVKEVLQNSGQPLEASARTYLEGQFDTDFNSVRIHTGTRAAESAEALNANAYTVGSNVVFGQGQYAPDTQSGRRLISHELTHVIQQAGAQAAPGIQCDTKKKPPAPPPAPTPLNYDNNRAAIDLLKPGQTLDFVKKQIEAAKKSGDILSATIPPAIVGTRMEVFLYSAIFQLGNKFNRNIESDVLVPTGPAKAGVTPVARITVRIDSRGAASAELIADGPVPGVNQTNVKDATTRLTTEFGFASVSGWSGKNPAKDNSEISDVVAALDLLKTTAPDDVKALKNVDLIRVPVLTKDRSGEFFAGSSVATGGKTNTKAWLKLADKAFDRNTTNFVGGGPGSPTLPASFQTILHEVGHAVEAEEIRRERDSVDTATAGVSNAQKKISDASASFDADLKAAQAKGKRAEGKFYTDREAQHKQDEADEAAAKTNLKNANDRLKKTRDPKSTNTVRLQKFVDLVNAKGIKPFTKYAAENWPANPEEFYAEAYSLWLSDSNFLKTNYKAVYDFFQNGDYRK